MEVGPAFTRVKQLHPGVFIYKEICIEFNELTECIKFTCYINRCLASGGAGGSCSRYGRLTGYNLVRPVTLDWSASTSGSGSTSNIGGNNMGMYKLAKLCSVRARKRKVSVGSVTVGKAVTSQLVKAADGMSGTGGWRAHRVRK